MTSDPVLAAALAALPFREVATHDVLHAGFEGRVTGLALVADATVPRIYYAIVRLEAQEPIPLERRRRIMRRQVARGERAEQRGRAARGPT